MRSLGEVRFEHKELWTSLESGKPRSTVGRLIRDHVAALVTVLQLLTFCASVVLLGKMAINGIPHLEHELGTKESFYVTIGITLNSAQAGHEVVTVMAEARQEPVDT